jgi:hypothetical protein
MYKSKMYLIRAVLMREGGEFSGMGAPEQPVGGKKKLFTKEAPTSQAAPERPAAQPAPQAAKPAAQPSPTMTQPRGVTNEYSHLGGDIKPTNRKFNQTPTQQPTQQEQPQQKSGLAQRGRRGVVEDVKKSEDRHVKRLKKRLASNPNDKAAQAALTKAQQRSMRANSLMQRMAPPASPGEQAAQKTLNAPGGSTTPATPTKPAMTTAIDGSKTPTVAPMLDSVKDWFNTNKPGIMKYAKPALGVAGVAGLAYGASKLWRSYKSRFDDAGKGQIRSMSEAFESTDAVFNRLIENRGR